MTQHDPSLAIAELRANVAVPFERARAMPKSVYTSEAFAKAEEEHIFAWADALREEYRAIVDAGLIVQLDDPSLAENFDQISPEPSIASAGSNPVARILLSASTNTTCGWCTRASSVVIWP